MSIRNATSTPEQASVLAYSVAQLAAAMGISSRQLYKHIERGDLTAKFSGGKMIIPAAEAARFLAELPEEDLGAL